MCHAARGSNEAIRDSGALGADCTIGRLFITSCAPATNRRAGGRAQGGPGIAEVCGTRAVPSYSARLRMTSLRASSHIPHLWPARDARVLLLALACLCLFLWTLPAPRAASGDRAPRRLALLVGISDYYQLGVRPWPRLHTRDELGELRNVLIQKWGFSAQDILLLKDREATRAGIVEAFRHHLINQASPGDIVFFHFSGHGQQLLDDNGDELDGLDESLVPYDSVDRSAKAGAAVNIRDDELGLLLRELAGRVNDGGPQKGNITVSLDSCFSGTAVRGILVERGRSWEPVLDGPKPLPRRHVTPDGESGIVAEGEAGKVGYVVLAAARSDQAAHEEDGMGVFSRALIRALTSSQPGQVVTYRELMSRVSVEVSSIVPEQSPQLEGSADALLFSGSAAPRAPGPEVIRVQAGADGVLRLLAGEVHGITARSVFAVHGADAGQDTTSFLGEAEVGETEPLRATLIPRPGSKLAAQQGVLRGAIAVEKQHACSDEPLRLYFCDSAQQLHAPGPCTELQQHVRKHVTVVTNKASADRYDVAVSCDEHAGRLELRRASSGTPILTSRLDDYAADALVQKLSDLWRWRYLRRLHQDNAQARVQLKLFSVQLQHGSDGTILSAEPVPNQRPQEHLLVKSGSYFMLELTNLSETPLYVSIFELDNDGNIDVVFPSATSSLGNQLASDQRPHVPDFRPYLFRLLGRPGQRSLLKLIATREPIDLSGIGQKTGPQGSRSAAFQPGNSAASPLARLLQVSNVGIRGATTTLPPQIWGTAEAWVEVVTKPKNSFSK